jgi:hypothetical protein
MIPMVDFQHIPGRSAAGDVYWSSVIAHTSKKIAAAGAGR